MSPTIDRDAPAQELSLVRSGLLPERYGEPMQLEFLRRLDPLLIEGAAVLDVGSGRHPTLAPGDRPRGCRYVGLDVEPGELAAAGPGAYDEGVVADVTAPLHRDGEFDLILSWQVLEHVTPLTAAFESLRASLRPGGTLLAQLTGSNAGFAVVGRMMPHAARVWVASRLLGHPPEDKFPTRYDRSSHRALQRMLHRWSHVDIVPFYRGANYLEFARPLMRGYVAVESALERRQMVNLATHYLVVAKR